MQILAHNPEIQSYSNEDGHFITGFLIGTKPNEARWQISKKTGHQLVQKFVGKDFAIIPELITKPLSQGGGGHYFGQDTKEDLLRGYAENSHGKYTRVKGPYSYNDGSDDYYYNFDIKLRDSKAAAVLLEHGAKTWVPYSHSPHIWPLAGSDDDIYDWEPIGGALVIKGAYGPQAVISKLCKGTAAACEKSLGASAMDKVKQIGEILNEVGRPCEKKDEDLAQIISSFCSKSASSQISMTDNKGDATITTPQITTLTADVAKPNATVNAQEAITNSAILTKIVTPEEFKTLSDEKATLQKMVGELVTKDRVNTLNQVYTKVKDEKVKNTLVDKWVKRVSDDDVKKKAISLEDFKEFLSDYLSNSQEEEDKPEDDKDVDNKKEQKPKSKGASTKLPDEPTIPNNDNESKAASVPVNKLQEILRFQRSGGRA